MTDIIFRNFTDADLDTVLNINQAHLPAVSSLTPASLQHLQQQSFYFKVAEVENKIAGFLLVFTIGADYDSLNYQWFSQHYDNFAYIVRIIVEPWAQRKHVGSGLYQNLENLLKQKNIPLMGCEYNIKPNNPVSAAFHESYGFHEVGQQATESGKKIVSLQAKMLN